MKTPSPTRPAHLGEGHNLLSALSTGILLIVKGQEAVLVLLHQSPGDDVAVAGCLDFVHLLGWSGSAWQVSVTAGVK